MGIFKNEEANRAAIDMPGITTSGLPHTPMITIRRARNSEWENSSSKLYYIESQ